MGTHKRIVLAGMVLALLAALLPGIGLAAQFEDCAVGYVGGSGIERVVITWGSTGSRVGVADSGSYCTELIAGGRWVGANKYNNWEQLGYIRLCQINFPTNGGESAVVHTQLDNYSYAVAYDLCNAGAPGQVVWY